MIDVLITKNNKIIIDPTIQLVAGSKTELQFSFQNPWPSDYKLYAVFKPVMDIPVRVRLGCDMTCEIPWSIHNNYSNKSYAKLGIGLTGRSDDTGEYVATNYHYVDVLKGAGSWDDTDNDIPEDTPVDDDSITILQGDTFDTNLIIDGLDDLSIIKKICFASAGANINKEIKYDYNFNSYVVYLSAEETAKLLPGEYTYDIIVHFVDGDTKTVIYNEKMTVLRRSNKCNGC